MPFNKVKERHSTEHERAAAEKYLKYLAEKEAALGLNQTREQWFDPVPN